MTTRRWTDADTTWFSVSGVAPELAAAAEGVLMDYQRNGEEWRRGYRADTPGTGRLLAELRQLRRTDAAAGSPSAARSMARDPA